MRKSIAEAPSLDDVQRAFGVAVKQLRLKRGLTQERLAELADLHFTYVSSVERGKRNVSLHNIHRLAFGLHTTAAGLMAVAQESLP